jgi:glycine oxidase
LRPDAIVVGAGIVGCAVARELSRGGRRTVVVERNEPGSHASWAAAGMLSPQAEAHGPGPFLDLLLRARTLFPALAAELREETGIDVGYRTEGTLLAALHEEEERSLRERHAWQTDAGLQVELLGAEEVRKLEPLLTPAVRMALRFPGDHQLDNRLLTRALRFSAAAAGAEFRVGRTARALLPGGEGFGVELENGERVESDIVVLAAGSWSALLDGLPRRLPVEPVHGQLLTIETYPPLLRHVIGSARGYMVPRSDGRLIVGTTVERIGFRKSVTPAGLRRLTEVALELAPALGDHSVTAHWSGLRPGTPDEMPILGRDPDLPGLVYATGHYRNGILLSALTGVLVRTILDGEQPAGLEAFRPDRF